MNAPDHPVIQQMERYGELKNENEWRENEDE